MNGFACGMAGPLLGIALVLSSAGDLQAAELQVLAGGGIAGPMRDLAAQFERASGHKLVIRFGTTPELIRLATTGGPFDLAVVPREVFRDDTAGARSAPPAFRERVSGTIRRAPVARRGQPSTWLAWGSVSRSGRGRKSPIS